MSRVADYMYVSYPQEPKSQVNAAATRPMHKFKIPTLGAGSKETTTLIFRR